MTRAQFAALPDGTTIFYPLNGDILTLEKVTRYRHAVCLGVIPSLWPIVAIHVPPTRDLTIVFFEAVESAKRQIVLAQEHLDQQLRRIAV